MPPFETSPGDYGPGPVAGQAEFSPMASPFAAPYYVGRVREISPYYLEPSLGPALVSTPHFDSVVTIGDPGPVPRAPSVLASGALFDDWQGGSLLASPASVLNPSPSRGWLLDSFALPTWDQLVGSSNSLGSTVLSFVEESDRADLARARLDGDLEIARLRATQYPLTYRAPGGGLSSIEWPDLTRSVPSWAIVLAVVLVLLLVLRKLL